MSDLVILKFDNQHQHFLDENHRELNSRQNYQKDQQPRQYIFLMNRQPDFISVMCRNLLTYWIHLWTNEIPCW